MSEPSPNPAENPDAPPAPNSAPAGPPPGEEITNPPTAELPAAETPATNPVADTPADGMPVLDDTAGAPAGEAGEEAPEAPPVAELIVTPAATHPQDEQTAGEPAEAPPAEEPLPPPLWEESDGPLTEEPLPPPHPQPAPGEPPLHGGPMDAPAAEEPQLVVTLSRRPTFGQSVVMIAGVLLFIWGFLPWYGDAGGSANAWSTVTIPGLLLTATWVPLLSLAIVIFVAIKIFADAFPDKILGFSWAQLAMVVGLFDVLISLGYLVANRRLGNLGSLDLGAGLILSFITGLAMLAGGVADHLGMDRGEVVTRVRTSAVNPPRDRD